MGTTVISTTHRMTARNRCLRLGLAVALLAWSTWATPAAAVSVPGEAYLISTPPATLSPLVIADSAHQAPLVTLASAAEAAAVQLASLRERNRLGVLPLQNGFTRSFEPATVAVDAGTAVSDAPRSFAGGTLLERDGRIVWSAAIGVAGAYGLRLHLEQVSLPPGTAIFVADNDGNSSGPVGAELLGPDADIWLPPVFGAEARVEIQVDRATIAAGEALAFRLGEVAELVDPTEATEDWTDCDIDATCITSGTLGVVASYREAVAHLFFMDGGFGYICSGALVNDATPGTPIPYLLTANHCFSTQASASSLIAYFDFRSITCDGSVPPVASVPHVNGSTLLATNASSDFTFVQLSGNPSGTAYYLGWDSALPSGGTTLHRISHPNGEGQKYSAGAYLATGGIVCTGLPRPDFLYTAAATGSTTGGSSGAPVIRDTNGGQIVGQLFGTCHFTTWDACNYNTFNWVDGAFATTYPSIAAWLAATNQIFADGFESGNFTAWSSTAP